MTVHTWDYEVPVGCHWIVLSTRLKWRMSTCCVGKRGENICEAYV
jgi:hypothetical protein